MLKCLFRVSVVISLLLSCDCLYKGDSCVSEDRAGTCKELKECQPLMTEIQNAGKPMPSRLRKKLQNLSCGFMNDEPMVCCAQPYTNTGTTASPWITTTRTTQGNVIHRGSIGDSSASGGDSPPNIRGHRNLDLLPTNCGVGEDDRIWGGNRTRLYEVPWMALLAYNSPRGIKLSCGATIITERYVLTAAHCVEFLGDKLTLIGVILGEYDVTQDPDCETSEGEVFCAPNARNVSIERVIAHPGYRQPLLSDDIALLKLAEPADFTSDSMKPICLPDTPELLAENLSGVNAMVTGWGATEDGLQSSVLMKVDLPVVDNVACQEAYHGSPKINSRQMCAGGVEDKDSCGGDSGGPLMYPGRIRTGSFRHVQRGIVSYGSKRCGIGGYPGVYTRISHYMDWILDNID